MSEERDFKKAYLEEKQARERVEAQLEQATRDLSNVRNQVKSEYCEVKQHLAEVELLFSIARLSQSHKSVDETLQFFIEAVCKLYHWPVAHIYFTDKKHPDELISSIQWYLEDESKFQLFKVITENMIFKKGDGLPGQVLASRKAEWLEDIYKDPHSPRAKLSDKLGLQSAFAVPIFCGTRLFALAEFWTENPKPKDEKLMALISSAATQVGTMLERDKLGKANEKGQKKSEEQKRVLEYLAYYDPLTNLPNRISFENHLNKAIKEASRKDELFALLFIGLDYFKSINDTLGHASGDALLKSVANRLKKHLREEDVVARMGGDEFMIIIRGITQTSAAEKTAKALLKSLNELFEIDEQEIRISASAGIACYPFAGEKPNSLQMNADIALNQAKMLGRNNCQIFESKLYERRIEQLSLQKDLSIAMEKNQFFLVYQPKYQLRDRKLIGVEALLRWNHPERGLVPPDTFIPLAEKTGLILKLSQWVFKQAFTDYMERFKPIDKNFKLAVNLSARQLLQTDFLEIINKVREKSGISAEDVELELTETSIMDEVKESEKWLIDLSDAGFKISIDDFGKGYSSLSYLRNLPIDNLKIDKSFVQGIGKNPSDDIIVRSTIRLAESLQLNIIAEGIETEEQLNFLIENNCHEGQGFYFSKPISPEEIVELLKKK